MRYQHPFHLVSSSPWPFVASMSALLTALGLVNWFHTTTNTCPWDILLYGVLSIMITMYFWWTDVVMEATFLGYHTLEVQNLHRQGVILFIVSEIMFFFSFFFAYFSSSLSPTLEIGGIWPPFGITPLDAFGIPLANTAILLLSGISITWAHHGLRAGNRQDVSEALLYTILLGVLFTILQGYEYQNAPFQINDGIYGSTFYMTTGFHGFHVIIGTLFIFVMFIRHLNSHFTPTHHVGLEGAIWYWNFVDIVWILLYITMYVWPTGYFNF